jgi:hypothetical protein
MKIIYLFLFLILFSPSSFALTADERDRKLNILSKEEKEWNDAKEQWNKELSKKEKELKELKEKMDPDAKSKELQEKSAEILKNTPGRVVKAVTGNNNDKANIGADAIQDYNELTDAFYGQSDIAIDETENFKKQSRLEKSIQDLNYNIITAKKHIAEATQLMDTVKAKTTEIQHLEWINNLFAKLVQAQQRQNDRLESERKNKDKKGGGNNSEGKDIRGGNPGRGNGGGGNGTGGAGGGDGGAGPIIIHGGGEEIYP